MRIRQVSRQRLVAACCLLLLLAISGACGGGSQLNSGDSDAGGHLRMSRAAALAELEALACPPGAEPQAFAQLKDGLRGALLAQGEERFTSAAPVSPASAVDDFRVEPFDNDKANLSWTYRNQGDYNQDKLVAVNDLTPVGVHFGIGQGSAGWTAAQIADGNGDGLVTVSDITPIGQNYLARVEGYRLEVSSDGNSGWQSAATYLFEESQLQSSGRRYFSIEFTSALNTAYYRVVPYDGDDTGIPSNVERFLVVGGEPPEISSVAPTAGQTGTEVTFSAVVSGDEPLSYLWDFGGGAVPNDSQESGPTVTLGLTGLYAAELTVTNAAGVDTFPFTLNVYAEDNEPPVIDSAVYDPGTLTLTVHVSDPDLEDTLTVSVTEPAGLLVDSTLKTAGAAGPFTAEFLWSAVDWFSGGGGETTVTVEDDIGATDSTAVELSVPALALAPDTLYAIPQQTAAAVDEPVRIIVATGVPASPFQYMNMVSVTVENGAAYEPGSFNPGDVGGGTNEVDGYWAAMDPAPVSMLTPPEVFIQDEDIGGGRSRWEFTLPPVPGEDETEAQGVLFNFEFSFGAAGTYTLGFQKDTGTVKRTYYSDQGENEYFWGDISNDHDGVPRSIVVY